MEDSLIYPNQIWANGLVVDTWPKQFSNGKSMHGIYNPDDNFFLLFCMHGCISYFSSWIPSKEEINTSRHVVFTSEKPWDPYVQSFAEQECAYGSHPDTSKHRHFATNGDNVHAQTISGTSSKNH